MIGAVYCFSPRPGDWGGVVEPGQALALGQRRQCPAQRCTLTGRQPAGTREKVLQQGSW